MGDLGHLAGGHGSLLHLHGLVHAAHSEAAEVVLLTPGLAVAADDLGNSVFCHKSCPPIR